MKVVFFLIIQVISLDGKEVKTLLTREDGIQRPQCVTINSTGDKLLVSSCPPYNNDYVSIFDLTYKKGKKKRPASAQPVANVTRQSELCSVSWTLLLGDLYMHLLKFCLKLFVIRSINAYRKYFFFFQLFPHKFLIMQTASGSHPYTRTTTMSNFDPSKMSCNYYMITYVQND